MVCNLTVGKAKFASVEEENISLSAKLEQTREALLDLVQKDADGFDLVMLPYRHPAEHDLQDALKRAAQPPLMMEQISGLTPAGQRLALIGNPNLLSDVKVVMHLIQAGVASAKKNVLVNANGLTDEGEKCHLLARAEQMYPG